MATIDDVAAKIEADMIANYGGEDNISTDPNSAVRAKIYAKAYEIAAAQLSTEVAGNQYQPSQVTDLITKLEWEYKLYPKITDDIPTRQAAIAAAAKLSGGSTRENVEAVLTSLLGVEFVAFLTVDKSEVVGDIVNPFLVGNWAPPGTPTFLGQVTNHVHTGPQTVAYTRLGGRTEPLNVGESMLLDVGYTRPERVVVTAVASGTFDATFTIAHPAGTLFWTGRAPNLYAKKRTNLVVLRPEAARDAETRRKVNLIMSRLMRATSQWCIAEATAGRTGPFIIGQSLLGVTPLGAFAVQTNVNLPVSATATLIPSVGATARLGSSAISSAPTINANVSVKASPSNIAAAPTISIAPVAQSIFTAAASSAPTLAADGDSHISRPAAASSAPTLTVIGQSAAGQLSSAPQPVMGAESITQIWKYVTSVPCVRAWQSDYGVTLGSTLWASGTSPPPVTMSGSMSRMGPLRVEIQTPGSLGTSTFRYSVDNGANWIAQSITTAASVVLTGAAKGITLAFPAGGYLTDQVYQLSVASWLDQVNGAILSQSTNTQQASVLPGLGNRPKFLFDGVDDFLFDPSFDPPAPATTPTFVWSVHCRPSLTASGVFFAASSMFVAVNTNTGLNGRYVQNNGGAYGSINQVGAAIGRTVQGECYWSASLSDYTRFGGITTSGTNLGNTDQPAGWSVGATSLGGGPHLMELYAMYIFAGLPTNTELNTMRSVAQLVYPGIFT